MLIQLMAGFLAAQSPQPLPPAHSTPTAQMRDGGAAPQQLAQAGERKYAESKRPPKRPTVYPTRSKNGASDRAAIGMHWTPYKPGGPRR